ncbi:IS1634 family transposase [Virgibacillus dakarensis]|uniref:IS1634 family transposase n=1 Tax=Virgibacillus dakarensis TaxID=1917889 RepID=UPI000B436372|nr:IS1634 family transposase [Virgibacillus dakarensis]
MATIRKQKVGKNTYWQIIESKRVNGKPRPVVLMHLGTAENLLYKLRNGPLIKKVRSRSHGSVELLWQMAEELDILNIFEQHFPSQKRAEQTVGKSLLLAAIYRALRPGSKRSFPGWAKQTTLPDLAGFNPEKLDSRHFWDQMDMVTDEQLDEVEKALTHHMADQELLSSKLLFYDLTNFATHIASTNEKSDLAKRGRNKQKRNDLKQFGLAQVVTKEFLIPVLSDIYEGNQSDSKLFIPFLNKLRKKLTELQLAVEEFTVVFDKGSNTKKNFAELDASEVPYVASLSPAYHEDLVNIPLSKYQSVDVGEKEVTCYRTQKEVWGKERSLVLYVSNRLREGQIRGLHQALNKKQGQLQELKDKLTNPRARKRKKETLERDIEHILKGEQCNRILKVTLHEKGNGKFDLDWTIDTSAYEWITEVYFGKRIIATSRHEWSNAEIIAAYQGQNHVEQVFKHLKNPFHRAVTPQFHWTDQKIKVHTFICLVGLLLSQLLWKKAKEAGYRMNVETLLDRLGEVRLAEIYTVHGLKEKPKKEEQLEEMDPELETLYHTLAKKDF